jgi:tetratricopeptide (TPR) repeat protein
VAWYHDHADGDCVYCHMPQRRTSDIVHAVMTDHWIALPPEDPAALVAPRQEREPTLVDVFLSPGATPTGNDSTGSHPTGNDPTGNDQVYRLLAVLQAVPHREAADRLERLLTESGESAPEPWTELGVAQLKLGRLEAAQRSFERVLGADPEQWLALRQLGVTRSRLGDSPAAIGLLDRALLLQPLVPELHYTRGVLLMAEDRVAEAQLAFERAVELRPTLSVGWAYLGVIARRGGNQEQAEAWFARALAADPRDPIVARERAVR